MAGVQIPEFITQTMRHLPQRTRNLVNKFIVDLGGMQVLGRGRMYGRDHERIGYIATAGKHRLISPDGTNWLSTRQPTSPVQPITVRAENPTSPYTPKEPDLLWKHDRGYLLSTAGLMPNGDYEHMARGDLSGALSVMGGFEQHSSDIAENYHNFVMDRFDDGNDDTWDSFAKVNPEYVSAYLEDSGTGQLMLRPSGSLDQIIKNEPVGVIGVDTGTGVEVVPFRNGMQVVRQPNELIKPSYNYSYLTDYDATEMFSITGGIGGPAGHRQFENVEDEARILYLITPGSPSWAQPQIRLGVPHGGAVPFVPENSRYDGAAGVVREELPHKKDEGRGGSGGGGRTVHTRL